jgi:imidazole glycerol phosphate synthase glutamine amidotransferase subunit
MIAGLRRVGAEPQLCEDADTVSKAPFVVLPGVGTFGAGIESLKRMGVAEALKNRISDGRPTLAVCVGHQLLFQASDESPEAEGFAIIDASITGFPQGVTSPQLGWNLVSAPEDSKIFTTGYAYFANSFRATEANSEWKIARADHGGQFVAGLERGAVVTAQFHPELSGPWGLSFFERWLEVGRKRNC